MTLERVGTSYEKAVGMIDVLITAGRLVLAVNLNVPACGRGHAQPRVAVHVIGANAGLEQLVGGVRLLDQELAGAVKRDRVRTGFLNRLLEPGGGEAHRLVPGSVHESVASTDLRREQPSAEVRQCPVHRPLDADHPLVLPEFVAANVYDFAVVHADHDAAAGAAEPADRFVPGRGGGLGNGQFEQAPGRGTENVGGADAGGDAQKVAAIELRIGHRSSILVPETSPSAGCNCR